MGNTSLTNLESITIHPPTSLHSFPKERRELLEELPLLKSRFPRPKKHSKRRLALASNIANGITSPRIPTAIDSSIREAAVFTKEEKEELKAKLKTLPKNILILVHQVIWEALDLIKSDIQDMHKSKVKEHKARWKKLTKDNAECSKKSAKSYKDGQTYAGLSLAFSIILPMVLGKIHGMTPAQVQSLPRVLRELQALITPDQIKNISETCNLASKNVLEYQTQKETTNYSADRTVIGQQEQVEQSKYQQENDEKRQDGQMVDSIIRTIEDLIRQISAAYTVRT